MIFRDKGDPGRLEPDPKHFIIILDRVKTSLRKERVPQKKGV